MLSLCLAFAVAVVSPTVVSAQSAAPEAVQRPSSWAVSLEKPGLPNLFRVTDTLYRGAQPASEGIVELKAMGIKTVLNLRSLHTDDLGSTGLRYFSIPMNTWHAEEEDAVAFLKIVTDTNNLPIFVHCKHGADRTGTLCAIYRIAVQGWTKDEAIREMTKGGYGFHEVWKNLADFVQALDVDAVRAKAGIRKP
jgi:protein tyrosine/serine phosphatase